MVALMLLKCYSVVVKVLQGGFNMVVNGLLGGCYGIARWLTRCCSVVANLLLGCVRVLLDGCLSITCWQRCSQVIKLNSDLSLKSLRDKSK